jgi:hypothetical protein
MRICLSTNPSNGAKSDSQLSLHLSVALLPGYVENILPRAGLVNFLEDACENGLQILKKFLCVPMEILKSKIRSQSLP